MKKLLISITVLLLVLINYKVNGQVKSRNQCVNSKFFTEEKNTALSGLTIAFSDEKGYIKHGVVKNNYIIIPRLSREIKTMTVTITYKGHRGVFRNIDRRVIKSTKDVEWIFGVDEAPFDPLIGVSTEGDNDKYKKIVYWKFDLLKEGDGIMFTDKQN
jgi:hypothetical protein